LLPQCLEIVHNFSRFYSSFDIWASLEIVKSSLSLNENELVVLNNEPIGSGSFSQIYKGVYRSSSVAVKIIPGNFVARNSEAIVLKFCVHPNVVTFIGVSHLVEEHHIVTEILDTDLLKYNDKIDTDYVKLDILSQISDGMWYVHSVVGLVHLDLKPNNVLIKVQPTITAKIADFGLAGRVGDDVKKFLNINLHIL